MMNASCNPYAQDTITLHCSVEAPDFNFDIKWIWQASPSARTNELMMSNGEVIIQQRFIEKGYRSRLNIRNLASRTGTYWCLAELNNGTKFENSTKFTLLNGVGYLNTPGCSPSSSFSDQSQDRCIHAESSVSEVSATVGTTSVATLVNETTPPSFDALGPALYAVVAVILVFCLVIVTLSVTIVVLYRRRCARVNFKTSGELN